MHTNRVAILLMVFAAMLTFAGISTAADENLGDILRDSGWDRIIGTWVDEETNGAIVKATYAWQFEDRVVQVESKFGEQESVALIGVNAKTGEVFHLSAGNQGSVSMGNWEIVDGDAILEVGYVGGDGEEGAFRIRHHLADDDTLVLTIELAEPVTFNLIRVEEDDGGPAATN